MQIYTEYCLCIVYEFVGFLLGTLDQSLTEFAPQLSV